MDTAGTATYTTWCARLSVAWWFTEAPHQSHEHEHEHIHVLRWKIMIGMPLQLVWTHTLKQLECSLNHVLALFRAELLRQLE